MTRRFTLSWAGRRRMNDLGCNAIRRALVAAEDSGNHAADLCIEAAGYFKAAASGEVEDLSILGLSEEAALRHAGEPENYVSGVVEPPPPATRELTAEELRFIADPAGELPGAIEVEFEDPPCLHCGAEESAHDEGCSTREEK